LRNAIGLLLRLYSYLYHLVLALFLIGLGIVSIWNGKDLSLGMLPWQGSTLTQAVLVLGTVGLVCLMLALTGVLRWLFPLWALVVIVLMARGFFLSSYTFSGADQFRGALWLTLGAVGAFLGSLSRPGRSPRH